MDSPSPDPPTTQATHSASVPSVPVLDYRNPANAPPRTIHWNNPLYPLMVGLLAAVIGLKLGDSGHIDAICVPAGLIVLLCGLWYVAARVMSAKGMRRIWRVQLLIAGLLALLLTAWATVQDMDGGGLVRYWDAYRTVRSHWQTVGWLVVWFALVKLAAWVDRRWLDSTARAGN